ncbi:DDE-type integrase/transposase/recombinase [Ruegeria aquimaris]|uniref:DDE-type integrase/transposase/recombinase n=1 Tax=Ruegeria aquimaris TaxID=2984333 RepID=UPI00384ED5A4
MAWHKPSRIWSPKGEVLEGFATKMRDKKAAVKLFRKSMKRHGRPHVLVTGQLRSYGGPLIDNRWSFRAGRGVTWAVRCERSQISIALSRG